MTLVHEGSGTVGDGRLVRWLHGELDEAVRRELSEHLARCGACRARTEELAERSHRLAAALDGTEPAGPAPEEWASVLTAVRARAAGQRRSRRLVAGLALAIVGGAALVAPPVRAWVAGQWERVTAPGLEAPAVGSGGDAGQVELGFRVGGPVMEIRVERAQSRGVLVVGFGEGERATARVQGGAEERLVVGVGGLDIVNGANSVATYEVGAPAGVDRVVVRIAGSEVTELTRTAGGQPLTVALDGAGGVRNQGPRDD